MHFAVSFCSGNQNSLRSSTLPTRNPLWPQQKSEPHRKRGERGAIIFFPPVSQAGAPSDPHHSYSSHFCPRISFTASGAGVSFSANFLFQRKAVEHEENVTESKNMKGHGLRARLPAPPRWVGQGPRAGAFGGVGRDSAQCHTPSSADSGLSSTQQPSVAPCLPHQGTSMPLSCGPLNFLLAPHGLGAQTCVSPRTPCSLSPPCLGLCHSFHQTLAIPTTPD